MCKILLTIFTISIWIQVALQTNHTVDFDEAKFPDDFLFGVTTASYQVEGAWNVGGRGESIWDTIIHKTPEEVLDFSTADEAANSYHLYKRDIEMLQELGVNLYRFSLSWPRIMPNGRDTHVNYEGLDYYDRVVNEVISKNITPMVTLYHWDLPQKLQDEGGFLNPRFPDIFEDYARLVFTHFGSRVKHWVTFNEPKEICLHGYGTRLRAPQLDFHGYGEYICTAHLLEAHAKAYHLYNNTFRSTQNGKIGITLSSQWPIVEEDTEANRIALNEALQFHTGLFAHPIFSKEGGYPKEVKARVPKERLPELRRPNLIKGTYDFMGINHYDLIMTNRNGSKPLRVVPSFDEDVDINELEVKRWSKLWIEKGPSGFGEMLDWLKKLYNDPEIIITENGIPGGPGLFDYDRAWYFKRYLAEILAARARGVKIWGYAAWSLMDNFEWFSGYTQRYGLFEVDFKSKNKTRTPRMSSFVYGNIVKSKSINPDYLVDVDWNPGVPQENLSPFKFRPKMNRKPSWKKIPVENVPNNTSVEAFVIEKIIETLESQVLTYNTPFDE